MVPQHVRLFAALFSVLLLISVPAHAWIWRTPSGPTGGNTIFGAAYAPELATVIAVDMGGSVLRKTGNRPWTAVRVPGVIGFESAHWTGRHFIISGAYPDEKDHDDWHGISSDGVNWTPIAQLRDNHLEGFASSPDVTVALDGRSIWISTDAGRTVWKERKLPVVLNSYNQPSYFEFIAYGNGVFVVANYEGSVLTSPDGVTWSPSSSRYDGYVNELTFSNGQFVMSGYGTDAEGYSVYELRSSTDGKTWRFLDFPEEQFWGNKILPTGSGFLLFGSGEEGHTSYTTTDLATWTRLDGTPVSDSSGGVWAQTAVPDGDGGAYLFGSGGCISRYAPPGNFQTIVEPGGPAGDPCGGGGGPFHYLAALGSKIFGGPENEYDSYAYFLGPEGRWVEYTDGLDHPSRPFPQSFHPIPGGVLAVAEEWTNNAYVHNLYSTSDGNSWQLLGTAPDPEGDWSIISAARSPQGRAALLLRSEWSEEFPNDRDYRFYFSDDFKTWQASEFSWRGPYTGGAIWGGTEDVVRHDGQRFLAVLEPGHLFASADAATWSQLPLIPDDTAAFRKTYYRSDSSIPAANKVGSFASNGQWLVASGIKDWYSAIDRFFVYSFETRSWASVVPPGARYNSRHAPIVRWSGSVFLGAIRDGSCLSADYEGGYIYTSPDGFTWTKRAFPVGGNLLDVVWTGTEFAALTFGSSVVTHPTGLSEPLPVDDAKTKPDKIAFNKIPPKVFGAAPFILKAKVKSGRPLAFTSSDEEVASTEGAVVTVKSAGTTTITATVAGDPSVAAVQQVLVVKPLQQKFSIRAKPAQKIGVAFDLAVKANSDAPLVFTSEPPGVLTVEATGSGYVATASAVGKIKLTATQAGDNNRVAAKPVSKTFTLK